MIRCLDFLILVQLQLPKNITCSKSGNKWLKNIQQPSFLPIFLSKSSTLSDFIHSSVCYLKRLPQSWKDSLGDLKKVSGKESDKTQGCQVQKKSEIPNLAIAKKWNEQKILNLLKQILKFQNNLWVLFRLKIRPLKGTKVKQGYNKLLGTGHFWG